jgi:hypothetical protein
MNSDCTLLKLAERDLRSVAVQVNCNNAPRLISCVWKAATSLLDQIRVPRACRPNPCPVPEPVAFSFSVPLGRAQGNKHQQGHSISNLQLERAEFVLERGPPRLQHGRAGPRLRASARAFLREDDAEDDQEDEDEDDGGIDEDATLQILRNWPVRAEPVSEDDEQHQFDTIVAGNVPTLFLGRAYTNGALNIMAMKKMQSMVEAMFYHLTLSEPHAESRSTVDLLLRALRDTQSVQQLQSLHTN